MLASWDLKVSPHWSPRAAEIRGLSGMLCALPRCSGSRKGLVCLGLSFSLSPFRRPSCMAAKGIFRIPRDGAQCGGPVPGDTFRDNKDCRIPHCVGGSCSNLLLWHMVGLGCFSAQLYLYLGLEWKAVFFFTLFQSKSGIRRAHPGSAACRPCGPSLGLSCLFGKLEVTTPAAVLSEGAGPLSYTSPGSGVRCGPAVRSTDSEPAGVHPWLCHLSPV